MLISDAQVEHVARLARLALSAEEKQRFTEQLNAILSYMEQLNEVATEGWNPRRMCLISSMSCGTIQYAPDAQC